jgi:hypothetical protein
MIKRRFGKRGGRSVFGGRKESMQTCGKACPPDLSSSSESSKFSRIEWTSFSMEGSTPAWVSRSAMDIFTAPDPTSKAARRTILCPARASHSLAAQHRMSESDRSPRT